MKNYQPSDGLPIAKTKSLDTVIRDPKTGAFFRASFRRGYDASAAMVDTISGNARFYFRRVHRLKRPWWRGGDTWEDTGEIWCPESGEFEVITDDSWKEML